MQVANPKMPGNVKLPDPILQGLAPNRIIRMNWNRKQEPPEPFLHEAKAEQDPPEAKTGTRTVSGWQTWMTCREKLSQRNCANREGETLEPFHSQTVTEGDKGFSMYCIGRLNRHASYSEF